MYTYSGCLKQNSWYGIQQYKNKIIKFDFLLNTTATYRHVIVCFCFITAEMLHNCLTTMQESPLLGSTLFNVAPIYLFLLFTFQPPFCFSFSVLKDMYINAVYQIGNRCSCLFFVCMSCCFFFSFLCVVLTIKVLQKKNICS